jgi:hypothetical protein
MKLLNSFHFGFKTRIILIATLVLSASISAYASTKCIGYMTPDVPANLAYFQNLNPQLLDGIQSYTFFSDSRSGSNSGSNSISGPNMFVAQLGDGPGFWQGESHSMVFISAPPVSGSDNVYKVIPRHISIDRHRHIPSALESEHLRLRELEIAIILNYQSIEISADGNTVLGEIRSRKATPEENFYDRVSETPVRSVYQVIASEGGPLSLKNVGEIENYRHQGWSGHLNPAQMKSMAFRAIPRVVIGDRKIIRWSQSGRYLLTESDITIEGNKQAVFEVFDFKAELDYTNHKTGKQIGAVSVVATGTFCIDHSYCIPQVNLSPIYIAPGAEATEELQEFYNTIPNLRRTNIVWHNKSRLFPPGTNRKLNSYSVYALSYLDQELVTSYHMWYFLNHAHGATDEVAP